MINKREKLQYAYVFALDLLMLFVSVLLAWLINRRIVGTYRPLQCQRLGPDDLSGGRCLFYDLFLLQPAGENIVTRGLGREFVLSIRFNVLMAAVYSTLMLLAKAEMLDSRYFAVAVPLVNVLMMPLGPTRCSSAT